MCVSCTSVLSVRFDTKYIPVVTKGLTAPGYLAVIITPYHNYILNFIKVWGGVAEMMVMKYIVKFFV